MEKEKQEANTILARNMAKIGLIRNYFSLLTILTRKGTKEDRASLYLALFNDRGLANIDDVLEEIERSQDDIFSLVIGDDDE